MVLNHITHSMAINDKNKQNLAEIGCIFRFNYIELLFNICISSSIYLNGFIKFRKIFLTFKN